MAYKTTSSPFDPLTLAEWRNFLALDCGITWANMDSDWTTELGFLIDEAHTFVDRSYGDAEWSRRRTTISVTGDNAGTDDDGNYLYQFPADFRRVMAIREAGSSEKSRARTSDLGIYLDAWSSGLSTHPWAQTSKPATWFFHSWDDSTPPQQQWARVGGETTVTAVLFYRPLLALLDTTGTDQYTVLPSEVRAELKAHMIARKAAMMKDWEKFQVFTAIRREEHELTENATMFTEDPVMQGRDSEFENLLG